MRVVIDCRKVFDFGVGTYVRGLLHGLATLEHDGSQYVLLAPARALPLLPETMERVAVEIPNYSVREIFGVAAIVDRLGADVFHSPHFVMPATRCPSVVTLHDVILFNHPPRNPAKFAYVATMTARAARKAQHILADTLAAADAITSIFDCSRRSITVAHLAVDERFLSPGPPTDCGYFLFVGNDMPHKNVATLIDAFALLRGREPRARLKLTGGRFARYGTLPGVEVTGFVPDDELPALYAGAIALVFPSREEGFGLPALEAMAAGTPVITSMASALVEITGSAALHVDTESAPGFANAMQQVWRDRSLREALQRAGSSRVREFSWKHCAEITRSVYHSVC